MNNWYKNIPSPNKRIGDIFYLFNALSNALIFFFMIDWKVKSLSLACSLDSTDKLLKLTGSALVSSRITSVIFEVIFCS